MKTLLKGGRVLDPSQNLDAVMDLLLDGDRIAALEAHIDPSRADRVVSLTPDQWVMPGLVDLHVHFRDPGRSDKETTATGAAAAIAGGYTTVCIMPNTQPTLDNPQTLAYVQQNAQANAAIHVHPICAISKELAGAELTPMGTLHQNGAIAFSDDGHCLNDANLMKLALQYARMFDAPIVCHAEDAHLAGKGCMHEGYHATLLGLPGMPSVAESVIVSRDIELARYTGGHVHFAHVSTQEAVALIRRAKQEGLRITAEVTPHHLTLTDACVKDYDPDFKMNPPLRSDDHVKALVEGLLDGTLDAIATDHAPHTPDEKVMTFDHAPCGVVGLETALAVILTHLVHPGVLTPLQMVALMSTQPAQVMKLPAGTLALGAVADVTVVDPQAEWVVEPMRFKSKSRNSPFKGQTLKGRATMVFAAGRCLLGEETLAPVALPV